MRTLPVSILALWLIPSILSFGESPSGAEHAKNLFTREGDDPSFAEVLQSGTVKPGERFSKGPVKGSQITVNRTLLEKQTGKAGTIPKNLGLHTQASTGIKRKNFADWTRWYQEDGTTQIFRLFDGEQNIRNGVGKKGSPGRVEVFTSLTVPEEKWSEWEGTYTIIKPLAANIFQLFHDGGQLWAFHIRMTDEGAIYFSRRRSVADMPDTVSLGKDMVGKSLRIKVRANGSHYEVFRKDPADDKPWGAPVATGSYKPAVDNQISFRWGMYSGSKAGQSIRHDALMFVSGVTIH